MEMTYVAVLRCNPVRNVYSVIPKESLFIFNRYFSPRRRFVQNLYRISGFTPGEIFLYELAMTHSVLKKTKAHLDAYHKKEEWLIIYFGLTRV